MNNVDIGKWEIRRQLGGKMKSLLKILVCISVHTFPLKAANSSTVANTVSPCKYVDAQGSTIFEKECLVYYGSLTAVEGVRECNWIFYDVHFTAEARANIWITEDKKCQSTINGIPIKVELNAYGDYNHVFLTEEGEIFSINYNEDR
jgi:hypothetical protein